MKNKKIKTYILVIFSIIFLTNASVYADSSTVVTLGKDLNDEQRQQMIELFKVDENDVTIIEVNNKEERKYLEGIASEAQLGKKTMSSAYVELLGNDEGISVETYNISWVTKEMYQSALVTAGVKDAKIIAAAPFPVSGTGALTGILKAFEKATGKKISEDQKKVANEEVFQTGELGKDIGNAKASELIRTVKEEIISKNIKDPEEIKKEIIDAAVRLDIKLEPEQSEKIMDLMKKISKLDLNAEQIKKQLKDIGKKIDDVIENNEQVKSLLQRMLDAIKGFFESLF